MTRPFYQASPFLLLVPSASASVTLLYYLHLCPPYDPIRHYLGISQVSRGSVLSSLLSLLPYLAVPLNTLSQASSLDLLGSCLFFTFFLNGVLDDFGFSFFYLFV